MASSQLYIQLDESLAERFTRQQIPSDYSIMGGFAIVEDRPTPKEVYNRRIYTFAAVACEPVPFFCAY